VVIGVGNPDRGDDAVGHLVTHLLRSRIPANVRVVEHHGEATPLLGALESADHAWLVDAAQSGAQPGTIHRIDCAASDRLVPRGSLSSHGFGVAEAIALARVLGTLPPDCIVYAIEASQFTPGAAPSPAVTRAAHQVAERILAELSYSAAAFIPPPAASKA
jgi:hydrogenase maturation protease